VHSDVSPILRCNVPTNIFEEQIKSELSSYSAFHAARRQGRPLPQLPKGQAGPRLLGFATGLVLHLTLKVIGSAARSVGAHAIRAWTAQKRIDLDHLWYEPGACGLNSAWTDLGLAMAARGLYSGAAECLGRSWRVHPCPHSTSFGLSRRLVEFLRQAGAVPEAVQEYERIAKLFLVPKTSGQ
jgi:hypothetical protein